MAISKTEYKAKIEAYFKRATYAQAKIAYEQINAEWEGDCAALNAFIERQGKHARHANGLTADYVKAMPEYKRLNSLAYVSGERAKTFNGVFTRVFAREHKAAIVAAREAKAKDHSALCATA